MMTKYKADFAITGYIYDHRLKKKILWPMIDTWLNVDNGKKC